MLRNLLCHSNDTGKSRMFFFQIRIFDGEMFNFLITFISFETLRVIQVFDGFKGISGGIWIIFIGIANKLDANAFATLEENNLMALKNKKILLSKFPSDILEALELQLTFQQGNLEVTQLHNSNSKRHV